MLRASRDLYTHTRTHKGGGRTKQNYVDADKYILRRQFCSAHSNA